MEDSRSVQEFQILGGGGGGGGGGHLTISNYWGGLVPLNVYGGYGPVTVNADLEPKTHHQTPMTCTYGFSHFRHLQNCCNRDEIQFVNTYNYVPIVVATDLEVHFSVLKKGVPILLSI